jgi:hypothetical protein
MQALRLTGVSALQRLMGNSGELDQYGLTVENKKYEKKKRNQIVHCNLDQFPCKYLFFSF